MDPLRSISTEQSTFECAICLQDIPRPFMCNLLPCNHSHVCSDCVRRIHMMWAEVQEDDFSLTDPTTGLQLGHLLDSDSFDQSAWQDEGIAHSINSRVRALIRRTYNISDTESESSEDVVEPNDHQFSLLNWAGILLYAIWTLVRSVARPTFNINDPETLSLDSFDLSETDSSDYETANSSIDETEEEISQEFADIVLNGGDPADNRGRAALGSFMHQNIVLSAVASLSTSSDTTLDPGLEGGDMADHSDSSTDESSTEDSNASDHESESTDSESDQDSTNPYDSSDASFESLHDGSDSISTLSGSAVQECSEAGNLQGDSHERVNASESEASDLEEDDGDLETIGPHTEGHTESDPTHDISAVERDSGAGSSEILGSDSANYVDANDQGRLEAPPCPFCRRRFTSVKYADGKPFEI